MSKITALKIQLAKMLASFSEISTNKGVLVIPDGDLIEGVDVYVSGEDGAYVLAEDGEYEADGKIIVVVSGRIESIKPKESAEPEPEQVEVEAESGVEPIVEEPIAEETVPEVIEEVVEQVVEEVVVDPMIETNKRIDELSEVVAKLIEKIGSMESVIAEDKELLAKMSKMSVGIPAPEIVEQPAAYSTGNKKLDDRLSKMFG